MVASMKYIKICFLLAILCFTPVTMLASSSSPVHAASLALNPEEGSVGSIIVVSGSDFTGAMATIYWDDRMLEKDIPISKDGVFNYEITVPNASKGQHTLRVADDSNWEANNITTNFNVLPEIHCYPDVAREWTPITISGKGFQSKEQGITIAIDGKPILLSPISADADGTWTAQYTVPDEYAGIRTINAFGGTTSESEVNGIELIVSPWMTLEPRSGAVGTQMIIEAWGFRHNEDGISLAWDDNIFFMNIRAEADGSILCDGGLRPHGDTLHDGKYRPTILVPETTAGKHTLVLYGSSFTPKGTFPEYEFEVIPGLICEPSEGKPGTRIQVSGMGFTGGESIVLKWDDTILDDTLSANNKGSFNTLITAPQNSSADHIITANGNDGHTGQANFTLEGTTNVELSLLAPADGSSYTLFNSVGSVIVSGFKYLAGVFSYFSGSPVDYPRSPDITFHWKGGGIQDATYILQISDRNDFSKPVLEKEIHDANSYTLSASEMLPKGLYYWRVMNIDNRGIKSAWSNTNQIEIISMPGRVMILSWVAVILVLAAIICAVLFTWYYLRRQ